MNDGVSTAASKAEISERADFSIIRYAQCWEDADTLIAALDVQPGDTCFSVTSGGENALSLLSLNPLRVIAVDLSPAQNSILEIKAAGFRLLTHPELLELVGIRPSTRRLELYERVRKCLSNTAKNYWEANRTIIEGGIVAAGKFENYLSLFRRWVLPLIHSRKTVMDLLAARMPEERRVFYDERWDNRRWRALFHLFFSRFMMGRLGRDPQFFKYVEGDIAKPILARTKHALSGLDTARNAYLHWIVLGRYLQALPHAWRAENFEAIRAQIDRLEIKCDSVGSHLTAAANDSIDRFNLSDIFEYMPKEASDALFAQIARCGRAGGRFAYWNMQLPRRSPPSLGHKVRALDELSRQLHRETRTFFYCAFYVEQLQ